MTKHVSFLGLGRMGGPMAARICRAGHHVTVHNRTPGRPGELTAREAGAQVAPNLAQAVAKAKVVCLCLGDESSVADTLFGPDGAVRHMAHGTIILDFTTTGRSAAVKYGQRADAIGLRYIDVPVTGGDQAAIDGTLTVMAGASEAELVTVSSILRAVSKRVVACGEMGAGQATKLLNQLMVAVNLAGVCEALVAADASGIHAEAMVTACQSGAAASWQLEHLALKAAKGDHDPGFKIAHLIKDLRLLAEDLGLGVDVPFLRQVHDRLSRLVEIEPGLADMGTQALKMAYGRVHTPAEGLSLSITRLAFLGGLES